MVMTKSGQAGRIPPQDIEAERALLGSIMLRPQGFDEIVDMIVDDTFYVEKHRLIFQAMLALHEKSEPIDLLSLSTKLKEKKLLEKVGGSSYLAGLVAEVPSAANLKHYGEIVHKKAALRKLIGAAEEIFELAYNEAEDLEITFDEAERHIFSIKQAGTAKNRFQKLDRGLHDAFERFDRLSKSDKELRGVPTGFADLDNSLAGLQNSDLIILAARPSMGKTTLALDIARRSATRHGTPVGIFSLEMSTQQLVDRMLAAESLVDSWQLRTGKIRSQDDYDRLSAAMHTLSQAPIFIDDEPGKNIISMRASARRLKSEHGLGLIVVDYLQLMNPVHQTDSLVQQVTEISKSLKGLARELDVPVIALSQLSRAVEHQRREPRLSDLRDSGSIEQDADVVLFIHAEEKYDKNSPNNVAKILIAKHRNGPTGATELAFHPKSACFFDKAKDSFGSF
jgi:replicative DNA helicase